MKTIEITIPEQCTIEFAMLEKAVDVEERITHYTENLNTILDTDEIKRVSKLLKIQKEKLNNIKSILKKLL
jgi:hypothetical protein